tara:strand:- start:6929 stop:7210 length:282 start_codon:yes stop_codon:yes gene_type:complete
MSNIEEKIGGLMADMRHVREDITKMLHMTERNNEEMIVQKYKMNEVETKLDKTTKIVNSHEKIKNRAVGVVAASGAFGAFVLYLGQTIIKVFM